MISLQIAIVAFVFSEILIKDNNIFSFYLPLLKKVINYNEEDPFDDTTSKRIKSKMIRALGGCSKCFAGQISLWYSLFYIGNIFAAIFTISLTILITYIFVTIHEATTTTN